MAWCLVKNTGTVYIYLYDWEGSVFEVQVMTHKAWQDCINVKWISVKFEGQSERDKERSVVLALVLLQLCYKPVMPGSICNGTGNRKLRHTEMIRYCVISAFEPPRPTNYICSLNTYPGRLEKLDRRFSTYEASDRGKFSHSSSLFSVTVCEMSE